ncbi:MAG: hypothetical protein M1824_000317 [Vezdaea acicularis]|nr:MAG: hypothetical protein M1824_000317 [Vezdaea acicularis]
MCLQGLGLALFLGLIIGVLTAEAVAAVRLPYTLDCVSGTHHVRLRDQLFDCKLLLHCDELDGYEIYQDPLLRPLGRLMRAQQERESQHSDDNADDADADADADAEEELLERSRTIPDDALNRCELECGCLREDAKLLYERLEEEREERRRLMHSIRVMAACLPWEEVEAEQEEEGGRGRGVARDRSVLDLSGRAYSRRGGDMGRAAAILRGAFPGVKSGRRRSRRREGLLGFSGPCQGWGGGGRFGQVGGF